MNDYYNLESLTSAIHTALCGVMPEWAALTIEGIIVGVIIILLYAALAVVMIYMERKVCAAFQCRLGPNRVGGKGGLLQVPADVLKMLIKEIFTPAHVDKFLYALAPYLVILASIFTFSCLPWHNGGLILHMNIGIFFVLAASSIGVLGILLAGWSSDSKYTLMGAMRSGAMIISYELSIGISVLTMVVMAGTMDIHEIVMGQADGWNLFKGHIPAILAFVIYLIAGNAEANRGPFDLAEAEQELTAGYHTEYSGMHFGFFYLAEYMNLFITAGIAVTLFLGGWMPLHIPGLDGFNAVMDYIPGIVWFLGKTFVIIFLLMWIRWTYPRLRIDQILTLEWKYLMPSSLVVLVLMTFCTLMGWTF
ncbi:MULTISPECIES: NADH-quinone oxidoreductase subunit NuoH [Bacteroides]|uniref:NADH-quinone oxidoreductase subunit H n=2 Tax=Bacteroidaceae TaxID=815 RepID=A0ABT7VIR8_9BACE|nr:MULTISPECIES: NADH-quinone oxidoreductase subunit NuoH [Bacteroides]MBU3855050.1 NADH-quinone oxidoreductase subunit NuoH [Candidatus Phocaeicola excrementipullorum]MBW9199296.1 NADH-quinone oxidoreductase subunit NuoH [Bacteroidales bacterium SW299]MCR8919005.1 NADH-quinone oxidoreductase subunit NuoH [Bacteroides sp. ET225]MDM8326186.1 NADH-quinone oxidoreductase subunit NuoH [Bacteroides gallinaceum]